VVVTGSTRSGTSLAAGTLHHLGLHVPQPVLPPNASNPAGFFESTWPIGFHRRLLDRALVTPTDARPEGFARVTDAVRAADRDELRAWLADAYAAAPQVVVKDPRATWVPRLWTDTAGEIGAAAGLLAMIRHPAEVIASRSTYYRAEARDAEARQYRLRNLCTWINLNTGAERITRASPGCSSATTTPRRLAGRVHACETPSASRSTHGGRPRAQAVDGSGPGTPASPAVVGGAGLPRRWWRSRRAPGRPWATSPTGATVRRRPHPRRAGPGYAEQLEIATAMARDAAVAMVRADRLERGAAPGRRPGHGGDAGRARGRSPLDAAPAAPVRPPGGG